MRSTPQYPTVSEEESQKGPGSFGALALYLVGQNPTPSEKGPPQELCPVG